MAVIRLSPQGLRDLLQLPCEAEVIRVDTARGEWGVMEIVLMGVGEWVEDGMPLPPPRTGIVRQEWLPDGRELQRTIDWRF